HASASPAHSAAAILAMGLLWTVRLLGPLGFLRFLRFFRLLRPFRPSDAFGALHLAELEALRLGDLAPALAVGAHAGDVHHRRLELRRGRPGYSFLLQRGPGERERVIDVAVAHLAGRRCKGLGGTAAG